jgi:hypothetical protein
MLQHQDQIERGSPVPAPPLGTPVGTGGIGQDLLCGPGSICSKPEGLRLGDSLKDDDRVAEDWRAL